MWSMKPRLLGSNLSETTSRSNISAANASITSTSTSPLLEVRAKGIELNISFIVLWFSVLWTYYCLLIWDISNKTESFRIVRKNIVNIYMYLSILLLSYIYIYKPKSWWASWNDMFSYTKFLNYSWYTRMI